MSECKHGVEEEWCDFCNPASNEDLGTVFIASFYSRCDECGASITEGDYAMGKDGGYVCDQHISSHAIDRFENRYDDDDDPFA
jgi:hypothetical protein